MISRKFTPVSMALLLMAPSGGCALQDNAKQSQATRLGLMAFWSGEGGGKDWAGGNDATLNDMFFENDGPGRAFSFNEVSSWMTVPASPSLNVGVGRGFTIECWIKPNAFDVNVSGAPIIEWDSAYTDGLQLWSGGDIFANLKDTSGIPHTIDVAGIVLNTNEFQNIGLTYDRRSGHATIYYNGAVVADKYFGDITPQTTYPVNIGKRTGQPIGLNDTYGGLIDSLTIYNRALSASEIKTFYKKTRLKPASPPWKSPGSPHWPMAFHTIPYSRFAI